MGRLARFILFPGITASVIFILVSSLFVQFASGVEQPLQNVEVGVETVSEYSQVYYVKDGQKVFLTTGYQNSRMPASKGEYIVWVTETEGQGQIFRYFLPTQSPIQISFSSTNLNPQVDETGKVVWEGWVPEEETWQVFYFDGEKTQIVSQEDVAISPQIYQGEVYFSKKDNKGRWQVRKYSPHSKQTDDVIVDEEVKHFELEDGRVRKKTGRKRFRPQLTETPIALELESTTSPQKKSFLINPFQTIIQSLIPNNVLSEFVPKTSPSSVVTEASREAESSQPSDAPTQSPIESLLPTGTTTPTFSPLPLPTVTVDQILEEIQSSILPAPVPDASSSASPPVQPVSE